MTVTIATSGMTVTLGSEEVMVRLTTWFIIRSELTGMDTVNTDRLLLVNSKVFEGRLATPSVRRKEKRREGGRGVRKGEEK